MTGHGDIPMTVRAMKAGAVDFQPKPFRDQDILDAVSGAIERDRLRSIARADNQSLRAEHETLTPRERRVMGHVVGRAPSWQRSTSAAGLTRDDPSASGLGGVVVGFGAPIEANVHDVENSGGEVLTLRVDDECAPPYRGWRTFAI